MVMAGGDRGKRASFARFPKLVGADAVLARLHAATDRAAGAAISRVRQGIDAGSRADGETGSTHALPVDALLCRLASFVARSAMERVRRDVLAAVAAVERPERALARSTSALRATGAHGVAIAAMLIVRARVEAAVRTHDIKLCIEEIRVADALTRLT
jgi:hypothetical protein